MVAEGLDVDTGRNSIAVSIGILGIALWLLWSITNTESEAQRSALEDSKMVVNINTASRFELMTLPGVGAGLSERILKAREKASFKNEADLLRVEGVTTSYIAKIRKFLDF